MGKLLTIKQASELLSVHPDTLRNWERKGYIKPIRIGARKDRRYTQEMLDKILNCQES